MFYSLEAYQEKQKTKKGNFDEPARPAGRISQSEMEVLRRL